MLRLPQPQAIRAVCFDVGFTLLAPHPSIVDIVSEVCARRSTPVARECLEQSFPHAEEFLRRSAEANPLTWSDEHVIAAMWVSYFTHLLRPCMQDTAQSEVTACAREIHRVFDHASSYKLYPDVIPTLTALRAHGLTLGVISDWGIGLGLILRHHDLVQYFDFAVISAAVRLAKPDPELFETALRRADAIPDYTVHIGDSYVRDVLGARAAGIIPILLDRDGHLDPEQMDCIVIPDLSGLLDVLDVPRPAR